MQPHLSLPLLIESMKPGGGAANGPSRMPPLVRSRENVCHSLLQTLEDSHFTPSLEELPRFMQFIGQLRETLPTELWKEVLLSWSQIQDWRYFLCQDPYTRWGYMKPRGFQGDARLMDFASRHPSVRSDLNRAGTLGRKLYEVTTASPLYTALYVKARQFAKHLNEFAEKTAAHPGKLKIASFGCGHGRELEHLDLETLRSIEWFHAIDTDSCALEKIKKYGECFTLETIQEDVLHFQPQDSVNYDFAYATGALDHLSLRESEFLFRRMLESVRPGGEILIANMDAAIENLAYAEAVMDWWPHTKTGGDMQRIAGGLEGGLAQNVHRYSQDGVHYLHAVRS